MTLAVPQNAPVEARGASPRAIPYRPAPRALRGRPRSPVGDVNPLDVEIDR